MIADIELTCARMNIYLLWLYSYDYSLVSQWRNSLWPDELEGAVEILVFACHVKREGDEEYDLLSRSRQTVEEVFPNKLMILAQDGLSPFHGRTRGSIETCLEILFEQQHKIRDLKKVRVQILADIFLNADRLFPKHKWLNSWIGRSPAFKAQFGLTRRALLKGQRIYRRVQPPDEDLEEADRRCEAFDDTIPTTEEVQLLERPQPSMSSPYPESSLSPYPQPGLLLPSYKPYPSPYPQPSLLSPTFKPIPSPYSSGPPQQPQISRSTPHGKKRVTFQKTEHGYRPQTEWQRDNYGDFVWRPTDTTYARESYVRESSIRESVKDAENDDPKKKVWWKKDSS